MKMETILENKIQKTRTGTVISKYAKTLVVKIVRKVQHPKYKKFISKSKKFYAHDEHDLAQVGDLVCITECRPLSKLKKWRLTSVSIKQSR